MYTCICTSGRKHAVFKYLCSFEISQHDHWLNSSKTSMPSSTRIAGSTAGEQRIYKLMTFAEVQWSGSAEGVRWGSTAVPSLGLDDSSIKSLRPALCRQTWCVLVFQYNQAFSENGALVWHCWLTRVISYQLMSLQTERQLNITGHKIRVIGCWWASSIGLKLLLSADRAITKIRQQWIVTLYDVLPIKKTLTGCIIQSLLEIDKTILIEFCIWWLWDSLSLITASSVEQSVLSGRIVWGVSGFVKNGLQQRRSWGFQSLQFDLQNVR